MCSKFTSILLYDAKLCNKTFNIFMSYYLLHNRYKTDTDEKKVTSTNNFIDFIPFKLNIHKNVVSSIEERKKHAKYRFIIHIQHITDSFICFTEGVK